MSRLILVRHGETQLNSAQRYWGRTDVPLGDAGTRQAERLRDRLKTEKIDLIYSSGLVRAVKTASVIASSHNLDATIAHSLNEIDFGELEGLTFEEVNQRFPEVARLWIERDPQLKYPGGESLTDLDRRVEEFRKILEKHDGDQTVLVVAHSGVLRTLICQLLDLEAKYRWQIGLDLASLSIVETYSDWAVLTLLNDVSHLK